MNAPKSMNYFIFDESNITALDINGEEMNDLYFEQKFMLDYYNVPNYIFAVDSLDESKENLDDTTNNLAEYLRSNYNIDKDNAVILLVSISPEKIKIGTGDKIKKRITDSICEQIIFYLKPFLREKDYKDLWDYFTLNIVGYLIANYEFSDSGNSTNYGSYGSYGSSGSSKKNGIKIVIIIICIVAIFIISFAIALVCWCKRSKLYAKIKQINNFFKANKDNKEIFKENCVICLSTAKIQLTTQTDLNIPQQQNETNENNIITLKCGHQYHSLCLSENQINDCPICTKQNNPFFKDNNERIIWAIQQDLFPKMINYNPFIEKNKIQNKEIDDKSYGGSSYSYPRMGSIGGGGGASYGGGSVGGVSYGSGGAEGSF